MPAGGPCTRSDWQHPPVLALNLPHQPTRPSAEGMAALTLQAVGAVSELQGEIVVGGAVGVQRPRHLPAADEAVLPAQHDDRAVDQLHDELLRLAWRRAEDAACLQTTRFNVCSRSMALPIKTILKTGPQTHPLIGNRVLPAHYRGPQ